MMLAKTYIRAAELISQGWWQTALASDDGEQLCLVAALWTASKQIQGRSLRPAEYVPLKTALARRGWTVGDPKKGADGECSDWNDVPGRTQDQVEQLLLEAAGLAE